MPRSTPPMPTCSPVLYVLVLADRAACPVWAALAPHAGEALALTIVHTTHEMEQHVARHPTDLIVTGMLRSEPAGLTVSCALYRAVNDQRMLPNTALSLSWSARTPPRLLWYADGSANQCVETMTYHARAVGGLEIYVVDDLVLLTDATLAARDAITSAASSASSASTTSATPSNPQEPSCFPGERRLPDHALLSAA